VNTETVGRDSNARVVSRVGERALAAVRRDEHLDVYDSQWAGGDRQLARVLDGRVDPLDGLLAADWQFRGRYDPAAFPRQVDALDIDAVYLVSTGGVRVLLPVWLGFAPPGEGTARGVLVRVETVGACRRLRTTVQFLKSLFHEAIALGWLDCATARDLLALSLRLYCTPECIHTPGTPLCCG
jgi:hypothetical protein